MRRLVYFLIILLTSAIWFSSCRSIRHIPIETVKHDSIYISKILHDSIYQRDSIYVDRKGDTVLIYKDRYVYKYKNLVDTFYIHKVDSVQVPYPVEKSLSRWQTIKMELGGWGFGIIIVIGICLLLKVTVTKVNFFIILFYYSKHIYINPLFLYMFFPNK